MRQWFYDQLIADEALVGILPGGIHAARGFNSTPAEKPFLVYRMSTDTPDLMDGNVAVASSQYVWVWAHDEPGDYQRIDDVLAETRLLLQGLKGTSDSGVGVVRWVDGSEDLADDQMGTICRFDRYLISHT